MTTCWPLPHAGRITALERDRSRDLEHVAVHPQMCHAWTEADHARRHVRAVVSRRLLKEGLVVEPATVRLLILLRFRRSDLDVILEIVRSHRLLEVGVAGHAPTLGLDGEEHARHHVIVRAAVPASPERTG